MGAGKGRTSPVTFIVENSMMKPAIDETNVGYHFGDLGKAEFLFSFSTSRRSTGHFGTGTYFVGEGDDLDFMKTSSSNYSNRPLHQVNFSGYNLYKPKDRKEAENLHDFLSHVNQHSAGYKVKGKTPLGIYKEAVSIFGVSVVGTREEFLSKLKYYKTYVKSNYDTDINNSFKGLPRFETVSTKYMKSLGYEGVDVRHIPSFNNSMYGSVIYDLKSQKEFYKLLKEGKPRE